MSQWVPNDDVIDGDEENVAPKFTGREGTIYLIDATIFGDVEQFRECLDCIEADLLKNILINARDLVSVVFFNTLHSPPASTKLTQGVEDTTVIPANCAVFIPLKPLSKDLIQYFKSFRESSDLFDFATTYGISNGSCFSEALWLCSRLIIRSNYKLNHSKIILFTNNVLPHMPGTQEQQQAFVRAKDLCDNNIVVDLVPMVDDFDFEPFYKEFICTVEDIEPEQFRCEKPVDQRFKLLHRMYRPNYQKSCVRHINFELAEGVAMSCDVHSFTRTAKKPNAVRMNRENREVVVGKRANFIVEPNSHNENRDRHGDEDGIGDGVRDGNENVTELRKVMPSQLFKSQNIGGKEILFSADEVVAMKSIQSTGFRLLGFKPLNQLKQRWMVKHCQFLYPNEKKIHGSTTLFRALWQKCWEKQKYALCTVTMRRNAAPEYIALVPQTADTHGNDGFNIIYLPIETNIGALDSLVSPLPEPTAEQVDLLEKICKKLRFRYQYETFSNPMLESFYANLEALVYDEEVKEIVDLSLPDLERLNEKLGPFLEQINEEFGPEDASGSRGKRTNDGEGGGNRAKTSKKDLSPGDVEEAIRNGRMEAVTVQHLKDFIRNKRAHPPTGAVKKSLFEFAQKLID